MVYKFMTDLPPGTPGSRTIYSITLTAREKEACERIMAGDRVVGDEDLLEGILRKIAQLPKIVVDSPRGSGSKSNSCSD